MSTSIDTVFIEQFEREVHHAFQREGSHLRGTTREIGNVMGYRAHFPKMGKATTTTKSRHAEVPLGDVLHERVSCDIEDHYTAEMVDDLDELKTNVAERQELAKALSYALGRKMDDIIITNGLENTTNETVTTGVVTLAKINEVYTSFGDNDVPDDGNRYLCVSPKGWTDLMALSQFADADYIPVNEQVFSGGATTVKRWFSFYVFAYSGLTKSGNIRYSMAWHKRSVGTGYQKLPGIEVGRENLRQGYSIVGSLAMGACMIDEAGIYRVRHDETALPS